MAYSNEDLGKVMGFSFAQAKLWWRIAISGSVLSIILSIVVVFSSEPLASWLGFLLSLLTLATVVLERYSKELKAKAEVLLRKLEHLNGFGWEVPASVVADIQASLPNQFSSLKIDRSQFYSTTTPPSTLRAIENLRESAFFTKHLSAHMKRYLVIATVITFGVALTAILIVSNMLSGQVVSTTARIVSTVIIFLISGGYGFLARDYSQIEQGAQVAENAANALLIQGTIEDKDALLVLQEYQIVRASAPLIPDWLYNRHRNKLNAAYGRAYTTT